MREAIRRVIADNPPLAFAEPEHKPVNRHLPRALDRGRLDRLAPMIRAVENVLPRFSWLYGHDKVPKGLAERYAFAEFSGPSGPVQTGRVILGLVLFAPGCAYPAHAHDGITESHYALSGSVSENDDGGWVPGSMTLNPPGGMHRITVGERNPALLAYAWHGPQERLTGQKMVFARSRSPRPVGGR